MASTAGKDGGIVSQSQGPDLSQKGVWSAKEQQSYRQQVVGKTFEKDTGYLANQIKALNQINKIYSEQLAKLDAADKKQAKAYQKRMAENTNLKTQLEKMYEEQEGSIEAIQEIVHNSNKQLKKSYKELGDSAALALENASKRGKRAAKEHLAEITRLSNDAITQGKEIEVTLKNAEKSTKTMSKGIDETLSKVVNWSEKAANVFNLQSLASNKFLDKANEQFEAINKINTTLGYTIGDSRATYSSLSGELQSFNASVGNLFSMDDMRQYIQSANAIGLDSQELLKDNLKSSLIQEKYFGVTSDTQKSMINFMKRTDTSDMSRNFNKTIISLMKQNVGINQDQLNAMTKEDISLADALGAAGLSTEQQEKFVTDKAAMTQILSKTIGEAQANALSNALNEVITNQATTEGRTLNYQRYGSNVNSIIQEALYGDMNKAYSLLASGTTSMNRAYKTSNVSDKMMFQQQLGLQSGTISSSKAFLSKQDEINSTFASFTKDMLEATDEDVDEWVKTNTAVSGIQTKLTWLSNKFEKWFGDTNLFYILGTTFFGTYLAANVLKFFKNGFNLVSGIGKSSSNLVAGTNGAGAKALGMLGTGAAVIGLTAGTITALGSYFGSKREEAYSHQYQENLESLKGTSAEGNVSYASALTAASASKSMTGFGTEMGNTLYGLKYGISKLSTKDKYASNKALTQWMYQGGVFTDPDYVMAWAYLMNQVGSLDAMNEAIGTSFTSKSLGDYIKSKGFDNDKAWSNMSAILNAGWYPYTDNSGGRLKNIEQAYGMWDNTRYEGYHKAGLDWVPRDNYGALLHKGEMVLSEDEAKVYRELKSGVGGESDSLYANQQKILYNKIVPASADVTGIGKEFGLPAGWTVTTAYGTYTNLRDKAGRRRQHRGIDFAAAQGTQMRAANSGLVTFSGSSGGFGNMVVIKDDKTGLYNRYGHAYKLIAKTGDHVNAGDLIALVGSTGNSTGPHLHYQVDRSTNYRDDVNPWPYATLSIFGGSGSIGAGNVTVTPGASTSVSGAVTSARLTPSTAGKRVLPGIGGPIEDGESPMNRITNSIDGVSSKIIKYLDEVRAEQAEQKRLINILQSSQAESSF